MSQPTEPDVAGAAVFDEAPQAHPLTSTPEFERFAKVCETLSAFDTFMDPSFADGWLCAIAASRRLVETHEWLPLLTGDAFDRAFADPQAAQEATSALEAWLARRRSDLDPEALLDDPDQARLSPLFDDWSDDDRAKAAASADAVSAVDPDAVGDAELLQPGSLWASGFLDAVDQFAQDWPQPEESDDSPDAEVYRLTLQLMLCLTLPPRDPVFQEFVASQWKGEPPSRDEMLDETVYAVQDLRLYWLEHGPKPEQRIVGTKVGRNDPCPCGSGKKYKKCHGVD